MFLPKGTSPGSSALRPQHLLDAVCGSTSPAASECLSNLTRRVNALLAGKLDSCLAPWFCGAPLTALVKDSQGQIQTFKNGGSTLELQTSA